MNKWIILPALFLFTAPLSRAADAYNYGSPGAGGIWNLEPIELGDSDYDGYTYFDTLNRYAVPLQGGRALTGNYDGGEPCSIEFVGYEDSTEERSTWGGQPYLAKRGIYHVRFTHRGWFGRDVTKDYYAYRASPTASGPFERVLLEFSVIKNPVEQPGGSLFCELSAPAGLDFCTGSPYRNRETSCRF